MLRDLAHRFFNAKFERLQQLIVLHIPDIPTYLYVNSLDPFTTISHVVVLVIDI